MKTHVVSRKNQIRSLLFVVILMVITMVVILKEYSIHEIIRVIVNIHPFYLLAGFIMMTLFVGCQAMNFYLILQKLGHPVNYGYCLEYACVGIYFGAITPGASGGQPAQLYYMNKDQIHVDISAITVFFMVFVSQIVILVMGGIFALLRVPMILGFQKWFQYLLLAGSMVMLILIILLSAFMFMRKTVPFLFHLAIKLGVRGRLIKKPEAVQSRAEEILQSYHEKSKMILKHPMLFVKVFLVTIIQWTAYYMVAYLVYLSFGLRESHVIDLMSGQALINIAVAAVPLPGSVGIAEKAYLNVFGQYYNALNLPSAMILSRLLNFYLLFFISFVIYLKVHFRVLRQKKQKEDTKK